MKSLRLLALVILAAASIAEACTVAVVSGKCTPDGRPLLWKHRDTDELQNALQFFKGERYSFIGLVDTRGPMRDGVWIGANSAGFAIMNSNSYNLVGQDTVSVKDREGILMRLALGRCATVDEFEALLRELEKPLGVEANFGVIDARGGAAFFEVDHFRATRLDANDPKIAPFGYIVHTNFSFTGDPDRGSGHIRFATATELFARAYETGALTPKFILQECSRCLTHSLTGTDLHALGGETAEGTTFVPFEDFIPRHSSSASVVIQGVRPDEPPDHTTLWAIVGSPLTSVVTPVWVAAGSELPRSVVAGSDSAAPICNKALVLKERLFPLKRSYGERYMNLPAAFNREGSGTLQRLKPVEDAILEEASQRMDRIRQGANLEREARAFYEWLDETLDREYQRLFGL